MGRWTASSDMDYFDEHEYFDRYVEMTCACGAVVMVPYRDGPPLGPLRCEDCQQAHQAARQAACGIARVTTQRKET